MIEVELPDGTVLEFPEGTPRELMRRKAREMSGAPVTAPTTEPLSAPTPTPQPRSQIPPFSAFLKNVMGGTAEALQQGARPVAQGMTMGTADEAVAAAKALAGRQTYDEALAEERQQLAAMSPMARLTGEIVGGGALGGPLFGALKSMAPRILAGGAAGAGYGFGTGEGSLEQRMQSTVPTGVLGAAVPFAAVPLAAAGKATAGAVGRRLGMLPKYETPKVLREAGEVLRSDRMTPQRVQQVARVVAETGEEPRMYDVGRQNIRQYAASQAAEPRTTTRADVSAYLARRAAREPQRIRASIQELTEQKGNFYKQIDDLIEEGQRKSKPLYDVADPQSIEVTDELYGIMKRPALRSGKKLAKEEAENLGEQIAKFKRGDTTTVKNLDTIKKTMDEYILRLEDNIAKGTEKSKVATVLRSIKKARSDFVNYIDNLSPDYKKARTAFAGPARSRELMREGRRTVQGQDTFLTARELSKLSPNERADYRSGIVRGILDMLEGDSPAAVTRIRNAFRRQSKTYDRMRHAFPDEKSFNEFATRIKAHERLAAAHRQVPTEMGSKTAGTIAESQMRGNVLPSLMAAAATPGSAHQLMLVGALRRGFKKLLSGKTPLSPEESKVLARYFAERPITPETIDFLNRAFQETARGRGGATTQAALTGAIPSMLRTGD